MIWTMPRPLVQFVGGALALCAVAAFAMGIVNAPERGRLPGERAGKGQAGGSLIQATDATPLAQERIEAPPPPPKPEEQADDEDEAAAPAAATAAATNATPAPATSAAAPVTPGPIPQETAPPADEPPH